MTRREACGHYFYVQGKSGPAINYES